MRAILIKDGKGPIENLYIGETATPAMKSREVLVKVRTTELRATYVPHVTMRKSCQISAFSLNRMDVMQRKGLYPTPPDASEILGVEFAGHVTALGPDTSATWAIGDQVLGLASGVSQHHGRTYSAGRPSLKPSFSWFRVPMQNLLPYRKRRSSASRRNSLGWRLRAFQRLSSQASANSALPS
jgi:threonine dehydrogenase-like Zn-dependent dehydrogenase